MLYFIRLTEILQGQNNILLIVMINVKYYVQVGVKPFREGGRGRQYVKWAGTDPRFEK